MRCGPDDRYRIWVEPFGLTRDLVEMCQVSYCMTHIAPLMALWVAAWRANEF